MASSKKLVRAAFRQSVFDRDRHKCKMCGAVPEDGDAGLDAHHITDRNEMPNGGYVAANGISLCRQCHKAAEEFHSTGTAAPGFSPEDLYAAIGSSHTEAVSESQRLR